MYNPYQYQSPQQKIGGFFRNDSALARLILINIIVFVGVNIINLFLWLFQSSGAADSLVMPWLAVPADLHLLSQRPWTLLTYMFFQEDFLHILFNMIVLYFGGRIFQEFLGDKRLSTTYVVGGLFGALFFILSYNFFPVFSQDLPQALALGASASVLAILVAAATYVPEYSVQLVLFGKLKLKHIAIILVVIDILSIQRENPGGHIAHLGGALWGFLSVYLMRTGFDLSTYLPDFKSKPRTKQAQWKTYKTTTDAGDRPLSDEEYNERKVHQKQKMDEILDKISRFGYEKLSQEEKEFLFKKGKDK